MNTEKFTVWAEITASIAVVVGLGLLILEIRLNTRAVEHQSQVEQIAVVTEPFLQSAALLSAIEKINNTDGRSPIESELIEHYELTTDEAQAWSRHLAQLWGLMRLEFYYGDRDRAEGWAYAMLSNHPDNRRFAEQTQFRPDEFGQMVQDVYDRTAKAQ